MMYPGDCCSRFRGLGGRGLSLLSLLSVITVQPRRVCNYYVKGLGVESL